MCVSMCVFVCVCLHRPAAYPPTTAGEHMVSKYAQTHSAYKKQHIAEA